jgi:hypothetical protein
VQGKAEQRVPGSGYFRRVILTASHVEKFPMRQGRELIKTLRTNRNAKACNSVKTPRSSR